MRAGFISFLGMAGAPAWLGAQVVTGVVRADSTADPLPNVEVLVEGSERRTSTGPDGRYRLEAGAGDHVVVFRLAGYNQIRMRATVARRDTVQLDVSLVRQAVQELPEVGVTVRPSPARGGVMAAFEERRKLGIGRFIDSTDLRRFEARRLSDLLRGRMNVRIVPYYGARGMVGYQAAASPIGRDNDGNWCWISVFLDGVPIYKAGSAMRPPDIERDFRVADLVAIEYYRSSSQVPVEFGTGREADCGALALWTRRGF